MRVLAIGTDRKLFDPESGVRARQRNYSEHFGAQGCIVFTSTRAYSRVVDGPLTVIPTDSRFKLLYGWDAWRIAKTLPRPDVITSQDPFETGLIALFIARRLGVPLHVQVHTDFTASSFARHSFVNWMRQRIAWFVLHRAVRIRTILQRTSDELHARGVTVPISVLPIYVDYAHFGALSRTKHPRWKVALLCVGRFEKEKRFELAIDALALARAKGHDIGLTLVGEGSQQSVLYHYAQRLRVADRLDIVGWQRDLTRFYAQADAVLVPSRYEGYGLTIVEGLASGVPVIATDVGVAREAGAIVVPAPEFAERVLQWIENGPRSATLAYMPYRTNEEYVRLYCEDVRAASINTTSAV